MAGNWELVNGRWCLIGKMGQVLARDGVTPHIGENGNWWIDNEDTGVSAKGPAGADGKDGKDGHTPVKGTDYFTEADKDDIVSAVLNELPEPEGGGADGKDGVTPHIGENGNWWIDDEDTGVSAKGPAGADGKDGKDGHTPVKGTDYFTEADKDELVDEVVVRALPATTIDDAGKFLRVDANGKWVVETVQNAEEVAY